MKAIDLQYRNYYTMFPMILDLDFREVTNESDF